MTVRIKNAQGKRESVECRAPAQFHGGCDIDGVDDFGCGFIDDEDELPDDYNDNLDNDNLD